MKSLLIIWVLAAITFIGGNVYINKTMDARAVENRVSNAHAQLTPLLSSNDLRVETYTDTWETPHKCLQTCPGSDQRTMNQDEMYITKGRVVIN
jgi:hypothetical protein